MTMRAVVVLLGLFCAIAAGCGRRADEQKPAISVSPTNNPSIGVERLFDHDGCTVYRFVDGGQRYYVKCKGGASAIRWEVQQRCGKLQCPYVIEVAGARSE